MHRRIFSSGSKIFENLIKTHPRWFLNRDSQSKIWTLRTIVSMETKVGQRIHFWTRFQKHFTWMDSEKSNRVFAGGGGGGGGAQCAPPPLPVVFGAQKKPGWDRVITTESQQSLWQLYKKAISRSLRPTKIEKQQVYSNFNSKKAKKI